MDLKNSKNHNFTQQQKLNYDLRHYPVRPHIGVGGIILWSNKVCIIKRKYPPNEGEWAIPGGHLHLGEKAEQGAIRECMEETGLKLRINKIASVIDKIDYDSSGKVEYHYVLCDYWMDLIGDYSEEKPPIPNAQSDAEKVRFVHAEELLNYNLTPTVIELFRNLDIIK